MQPTCHALAALLLERDRVEEATAVYRADLGYDDTLSRACRHPDNVWSLHGYHECLERLGRHAEAAIVRQKLQIAMARTDVPGDGVMLLPVAHAVGERDAHGHRPRTRGRWNGFVHGDLAGTVR